GTGTRQNFKKAAHWLKEAAMQGHVNAQNLLAIVEPYNQPAQPVAQTWQQLYEQNRTAAELGEAEAQYKLGLVFANCESMKDPEQAALWYGR
ncbi:tetratricopeptide repeat protein, partial [Vibrio parahaemolyticus]